MTLEEYKKQYRLDWPVRHPPKEKSNYAVVLVSYGRPEQIPRCTVRLDIEPHDGYRGLVMNLSSLLTEEWR